MSIPNFDIEKFKKCLKKRNIDLIKFEKESGHDDDHDPWVYYLVKRVNTLSTQAHLVGIREYTYNEEKMALRTELSLDSQLLTNILKKMFESNPRSAEHNLKLTIKQVKKQIESEK
jgi:hypothetical protein